MIDLERLLLDIKSLAVEVGEYQKTKFMSKDLQVESKDIVIDLVTEADKKSEEIILSFIKKKFPDHSILAEESGQNNQVSDYLWAIDPLDGTINYAKGIPIFSISIALQYKGATILGIVYAPFLNQMFETIKGKGAYLNGHKISVSKVTSLEKSVLATGFPYDRATSSLNNTDYAAHLIPRLSGIRRMGSAAYDLASVAAGHLDGYWEMCLNLWDAAAGMLLVEEAGGEFIHFRNDRKISIIAGNPEIIKKIQTELSAVDKVR
ncbi:MAG: inositol monophosphatase [Spirochaetes bacterium]|nr:inositol monophosphatase [Spirochaetota bacterium]